MKTTIDKKKFGPWAIVTGASSGIGKEFAKQIASNGINIVLVARRLSLLKQVGDELTKKFGVECRVVEADLSTDDFIEKITKITDDLDIGLVISNAGFAILGQFLKSNVTEQLAIVKLNVATNLVLVHHFGQKLAKRGSGGILLVSAMWASGGIPYLSNYAATKAYVTSLGEGLHVEFKKFGVHVTVLLPGPTDTPAVSRTGIDPKNAPVKLMPVEQCVSEGLDALNANHATHIAGSMNRFMTAIIPRSVIRNMTVKMMKDVA